MHVCVVTARAIVLWRCPDIYCNYYVRANFKLGGAPGCYDARGNTELLQFGKQQDITLQDYVEISLMLQYK